MPNYPKRNPYTHKAGPMARAYTALAEATETLIAAEAARNDAARRARAVGLSFAQIGDAAGMTKQAAWERFREGIA